MISRTIKPGTKVWHEVYSFGVFKKYVSKIGISYGFALVRFAEHPEVVSIIHPKKLTEIEEP